MEKDFMTSGPDLGFKLFANAIIEDIIRHEHAPEHAYQANIAN